MTAGGAATACGADARAGRAGGPLPGRPRRRLDGGRGRLREPLRQLLLRRARALQGRVLMTVAAGSVAYRERGFAIRLAGRPGRPASPPGARVKLDRSRAALVVVDVQEAFRPRGARLRARGRNVATWSWGARVLGLPVLVTEQYPKGLGHTVPEVEPSTSTRSSRSRRSASARSQADGFARGSGGRAATRCCCAASSRTSA